VTIREPRTLYTVPGWFFHGTSRQIESSGDRTWMPLSGSNSRRRYRSYQERKLPRTTARYSSTIARRETRRGKERGERRKREKRENRDDSKKVWNFSRNFDRSYEYMHARCMYSDRAIAEWKRVEVDSIGPQLPWGRSAILRPLPLAVASSWRCHICHVTLLLEDCFVSLSEKLVVPAKPTLTAFPGGKRQQSCL